MKSFAFLALFGLSLNVGAQPLTLKDYPFTMTDILSRGHNRNTLYQSMNTEMLKLSSSICSNRALIWVNDFKRFYGIDAAKIFLFYTGKTGRAGRKTWWYHVAPMVNEGGRAWVVDPGFPAIINSPLSMQEWLVEFAGTSNCREIRAGQNELIERMYSERVFPEYTREYGRADCYYHIAPAGLWTPGSVASHLLGTDAEGRPTPYKSTEINIGEVFDACTEAASTKLGRILGDPKKKCRRYLGLRN